MKDKQEKENRQNKEGYYTLILYQVHILTTLKLA